MGEVLSRKRKEIISALLDNLSHKNNDFEKCINAHSVFLELADNENMFGHLIANDHIVQLITVACDSRNANQAYALGLLATIIKEFPDRESSLGQNVVVEFQ
jgi:hypothetical protein